MTDDFKDEPQSIGELRASKDNDATKLTPRELLIHALRRIDNGEIAPERCVLIMVQESKQEVTMAVKDNGAALVMLEDAAFSIRLKVFLPGMSQALST